MDKDKKWFILWEQEVFGYGYGTGEKHVLKALQVFLSLCPIEGCYDHEILENGFHSPGIAWLLINILCKADILEYGISTRFAWLTAKGVQLKLFIGRYTVDELAEMVNITEDENFELHAQDTKEGE